MSKVQHYPILFEYNSYQWKVHYFLSNNGLYSILCIQSIKLKIFLQTISMVAFLPPHGLAMMTLDNPHLLSLKTNSHDVHKLIIIIISIIIKPISSLIMFYNLEKQHTCNVIRFSSHAYCKNHQQHHVWYHALSWDSCQFQIYWKLAMNEILLLLLWMAITIAIAGQGQGMEVN